MLSIENPSCSSQTSAASDLVRAAPEDDQPQPPNFSIRDYVFKSRRKDIRINWPFREQILQLFLDNGISDLLPPLEPPILVRGHCFRKQVESEQLPKCAKNKSIFGNGESRVDVELDLSLPVDSLAVLSSVQSQHSLPKGRREFKLQQESIPDNKLTLSESEINASSVTCHDLSEGSSGEQLKKCRLVAKPFTGSETSAPEGLVSDLITVSDSMASKVCPVCKLFTSTSNTTLNAHIDQCLSSDQSNATRDVTELSKPQVKPRKKRLMVDIYIAAPHCTLEDLDRRNGTNWAASLAVVAPESDVNLETKRMKLSPLEAVNEGNVGDIYVDSNGTKLLILSNDSPPLVSRKSFKMKNYGKGLKAGRSCSAKKKILKPMCSKSMEDNWQNRKLSRAKGFKGEVEAAAKANHIVEAHQEKEESGSELLSAHDHQVRNRELSTLGHWVCSKRSDLSRKHDDKNINKRSEKIVITRKLSFRHTQPDSPPSSIQKNCGMNLPSTSEAMVSPKTKCTNTPSKTARGMDGGKKISPQSSNLNSKLLKADSLADSHMPKISRPYASCHPSLISRKILTSKKRAFSRRTCISLKEMEGDKNEGFIPHEKLKKNRLIIGCSKWREERYSDVNGECDVSTEDFGLISPRANKTSKIHQSNFFENQEKGSLGTTNTMVTETNALAYDASLDPSPEETVESISRDETQVGREYSNETEVELLAQRSTSYQEAQCRDAFSNEVISQEIQISGDQAEPILQHGECRTNTSSIQEPNPRVTSDAEMGVEDTQENSSATLVRVESNQFHNMVFDMESSGSAVSTTSTISPPSPVDGKIKDSEVDRFAEYNPLPGKLSSLLAGNDKNVQLSPPPREPSCSCSKSLSRESQFSNHRRSSNLFIKPPTLSSFQQFCPSLESHTESVLTMDSSKSAINVSNSCSQSKSASKPILRLMGKDLVVSKGESVQLPTILPCDSEYTPEAKFVSFGLPNNLGLISFQNPYNYQIHALANHQIPVQPLQRISDKFSSPLIWSMDRMAAPLHPQPKSITPSYQAQEVIVIDDDPQGLEPNSRTNFTTFPQPLQNPNLMGAQRLFAGFPSQNPYSSRVFTSSQRETSEGSFMFPSPASLYFSPTLR